MKRFKKLIGASVVVALASQINIGILNTDFRISAGIVFLAIYLYYNKDLKPIETGLISGIAVYVFRVLLHILGKGNLGDVVFSYQLEILFYTFYGVIYSLLLKSGTRENVNQLFLILVASDFGANLIEASFRALHEALQFNYDLITTLLLVAVVRSSVVWVVITGLKYYKILLLKEEHELRYARLLWLTAQLNLKYIGWPKIWKT